MILFERKHVDVVVSARKTQVNFRTSIHQQGLQTMPSGSMNMCFCPPSLGLYSCVGGARDTCSAYMRECGRRKKARCVFHKSMNQADPLTFSDVTLNPNLPNAYRCMLL